MRHFPLFDNNFLMIHRSYKCSKSKKAQKKLKKFLN